MIEHSPFQAAISAHFAALRNQQVEIPEWDGMVIHFSPLNAIEVDEIEAIKGGRTQRDIQILIRKAKTEAGSPCFTEADIGWLKREAAPFILRYVANRILTADMVDVKTLGEPSPPPKEA
jgi:hypothetical protein